MKRKVVLMLSVTLPFTQAGAQSSGYERRLMFMKLWLRIQEADTKCSLKSFPVKNIETENEIIDAGNGLIKNGISFIYCPVGRKSLLKANLFSKYERKYFRLYLIGGDQCDQIVRLFFQYLAVYNIEHLPNRKKIIQSMLKIFTRTK